MQLKTARQPGPTNSSSIVPKMILDAKVKPQTGASKNMPVESKKNVGQRCQYPSVRCMYESKEDWRFWLGGWWQRRRRRWWWWQAFAFLSQFEFSQCAGEEYAHPIKEPPVSDPITAVVTCLKYL